MSSRQSPLLSFFDEASFELGEFNGMTVALSAHQRSIRTNYLADLSAFPRRLVVGQQAGRWLSEQGIGPLGLLQAVAINGSGLVVRLHKHEYLVLDDAQRSAESFFELPDGRHGDVLLLPYEAAEIVCGGPDCLSVISELCSADMASCGDPAWVMTRFAHAEVVLRVDTLPHYFRLICTPADAAFLFEALAEINASRDGMCIGLEDFLQMRDALPR